MTKEEKALRAELQEITREIAQLRLATSGNTKEGEKLVSDLQTKRFNLNEKLSSINERKLKKMLVLIEEK